MPNWWVIYAKEGVNDTELYAKALGSKKEAQTWANKTPGIVVVDIAEGEKKD